MNGRAKRATSTPALQALARAGVAVTVHEFTVDTIDAELGYGKMAALALGVDEHIVFKTLLANVDGAPTVAVVPVAGNLSLKALAAALHAKRATMMEVADAERLTGYVVGGISPFGQKRVLPTVLDDSALPHQTILVSGGRRGLDIEIPPTTLTELLNAVVAPIRSG